MGNSHSIRTCQVVWFRHSLSSLQHLREADGISPRIGGLTPTEYLPHCHSKCPLVEVYKALFCCVQHHILTYHITFPREPNYHATKSCTAVMTRYPLCMMVWLSHALTYHITFLREVSITETLWSHPLDREFGHLSIHSLSIVVPLKHILRQTKV